MSPSKHGSMMTIEGVSPGGFLCPSEVWHLVRIRTTEPGVCVCVCVCVCMSMFGTQICDKRYRVEKCNYIKTVSVFTVHVLENEI